MQHFIFRAGISTENAIYSLLRDIFLSFSRNNCCIGAFLDLKKAFDMFKHYPVEKATIFMAFTVVSMNGSVTIYLTDRSQYDVLIGESSSFLGRKCVILQVRIIGLFFFYLVYM